MVQWRTVARARTAVTAATLSVVTAMGLAACSDSSADEIAYAVDGTLTTYNTCLLYTSDAADE